MFCLFFKWRHTYLCIHSHCSGQVHLYGLIHSTYQIVHWDRINFEDQQHSILNLCPNLGIDKILTVKSWWKLKISTFITCKPSHFMGKIFQNFFFTLSTKMVTADFCWSSEICLKTSRNHSTFECNREIDEIR